MARGAAVLIATAMLSAVAVGAYGRDQELQAVLQSSGCVASRVVPNRLSPTLIVYEVTCKQSERVVRVECLETKCRRLVSAEENETE